MSEKRFSPSIAYRINMGGPYALSIYIEPTSGVNDHRVFYVSCLHICNLVGK